MEQGVVGAVKMEEWEFQDASSRGKEQRKSKQKEKATIWDKIIGSTKP